MRFSWIPPVVIAGLVAAPATGRAQALPPGLCPSAAASAALPEWQPSAKANHGVEEFDRDVRITFPSGVSVVDLEVWGGGGGGGGGAEETFLEGGAGGGGGASGGYSRTRMSVVAGATYTLIVGRGGRGGLAARGATHASNGEDGAYAAVCDETTVIAAAPGGAGGEGARGTTRGGAGGRARVVATTLVSTNGSLNRPGFDGARGAAALAEYRGWGGRGGPPPGGSVLPGGAFGGTGGPGALRPESPGEGLEGGRGRVIVGW